MYVTFSNLDVILSGWAKGKLSSKSDYVLCCMYVHLCMSNFTLNLPENSTLTDTITNNNYNYKVTSYNYRLFYAQI